MGPGVPGGFSPAGSSPGALVSGGGGTALNPGSLAQVPLTPSTYQPFGQKLDATFLPGPSGGGFAPGGAVQNVAGLVQAGTTASGAGGSGSLTFTQYGGPSDRTPDPNTRAGIGNRGNRLREGSLALSPNLIREYGLKGGETISVRTPRGIFYLGTYDDTTGGSRNNVIDIYDPGDRLGQDDFTRNIPAGQWELVVGQRIA